MRRTGFGSRAARWTERKAEDVALPFGSASPRMLGTSSLEESCAASVSCALWSVTTQMRSRGRAERIRSAALKSFSVLGCWGAEKSPVEGDARKAA